MVDPDARESADLGSLRRRLYLLAFVDEFVPFAVLFTLWFDDNGVTVAELSVVLVMWAGATLLLEVPSGMVADRVDRRALLAGAFALRAIGVGVWILQPSLTGLLIGGGLWAVHGAAASGAWEALIHDELEAVGAQDRYGVVIARVGQFGHGGTAAAALVSTPLLGAGLDLAALGWFTVATHVVSIALVLSLPDVGWVVARARETGSVDDTAGSARTVIELLRRRAVFVPVAVGIFVGGLAILDEYVPLLARNRGLDDPFVPLVFLSVWIGLLVGGEVAARQPAPRPIGLAALVVVGGATALSALTTNTVWTLPLIAIAYAAIELTWVVADARMQAHVPAHVRATMTSVREFGVGAVAGMALAVTGIMSDDGDPTSGLIVVAVALIATGPLVAQLPRRTGAAGRTAS